MTIYFTKMLHGWVWFLVSGFWFLVKRFLFNCTPGGMWSIPRFPGEPSEASSRTRCKAVSNNNAVGPILKGYPYSTNISLLRS